MLPQKGRSLQTNKNAFAYSVNIRMPPASLLHDRIIDPRKAKLEKGQIQ